MAKHREHYYSFCVVSALLLLCGNVTADLQCSVSEEEVIDPNMRTMTYDIGRGQQSFLAWKMPDVTTFYKDQPPASKKVSMKFDGIFTKFVSK